MLLKYIVSILQHILTQNQHSPLMVCINMLYNQRSIKYDLVERVKLGFYKVSIRRFESSFG